QGPGAEKPWIYPLLIAGKGLSGPEQLEGQLTRGGFYGYKVYLPWHGDDYGDLRVEDMLGPVEMELADRQRLIVLLHVPRAGRLADPEIQAGVRALAREYPHAQIVLAHCGRCYHPDEMKAAAPALTPLENVHLDTSMVMDPLALQILLEHVPSQRLLFATDFPVPAMRGRRVYVMDHWVDLVLPGYPESAYRVQSDSFRASFMVYEIIQAIRRAAERVGLSSRETEAVFHDNGARLLQRVLRPGA
ncbi:MAG: amidohydrolase family protein, partial [Spirochaetales bacterium]|nr:amidohydrolase family protein [Spirochaetales bacterium]